MTPGRTDVVDNDKVVHTRAGYLALSWDEQKVADLRRVFDATANTDLSANCIQPGHRDGTASMVIYKNGVWCFGCRTRWWPDQFLRTLGDLPLSTERGNRRSAETSSKYIPLAVADTYRHWLWDQDGPYASQQKWLLDRGLDRLHCMDNMIGHTGEAYTIPVFEHPADGAVASIRYRRDDQLASEERPKYWGTAGVNQAMLYRPVGPVIKFPQSGLLLCEGELDALRVRQEGYPAVSLTNGCGAIGTQHVDSIWQIAKSYGNKITVVYDQDKPGREAAARAVELLGGFAYFGTVRSASWLVGQGKDATEYLQYRGANDFFIEVQYTWRCG